jgi:hypothetical protein
MWFNLALCFCLLIWLLLLIDFMSKNLTIYDISAQLRIAPQNCSYWTQFSTRLNLRALQCPELCIILTPGSLSTLPIKTRLMDVFTFKIRITSQRRIMCTIFWNWTSFWPLILAGWQGLLTFFLLNSYFLINYLILVILPSFFCTPRLSFLFLYYLFFIYIYSLLLKVLSSLEE